MRMFKCDNCGEEIEGKSFKWMQWRIHALIYDGDDYNAKQADLCMECLVKAFCFEYERRSENECNTL